MYLWHTIRYNTRNGIYDLFFTQMISFIQMLYHYIDEWRTHIRMLRMMTCTCVHQSIWINRIPMNYKAFGLFFSFFSTSNRTFLHITLRYCLLNKFCYYFHFYLFLILNKNVFKRKCKRHTGANWQRSCNQFIYTYVRMVTVL